MVIFLSVKGENIKPLGSTQIHENPWQKVTANTSPSFSQYDVMKVEDHFSLGKNFKGL